MAVNQVRETSRHVTYEVDSNDPTPAIELEEYFEASAQLMRVSGADGSVAVEVTNDPNGGDWYQLSSHNAEALKELPPLSAVRFVVSGWTAGTHRIHLFRIER